jgi:hypothetical protein
MGNIRFYGDDTEGNIAPQDNESIAGPGISSPYHFQSGNIANFHDLQTLFPQESPIQQQRRRPSISSSQLGQSTPNVNNPFQHHQNQQTFTSSHHGNAVFEGVSEHDSRQESSERYGGSERYMQSQAKTPFKKYIREHIMSLNMGEGSHQQTPKRARHDRPSLLSPFSQTDSPSSFRQINTGLYGDPAFYNRNRGRHGAQSYSRSPHTPIEQRGRSPSPYTTTNRQPHSRMVPPPKFRMSLGGNSRATAPQTPGVRANRLYQSAGDFRPGFADQEMDETPMEEAPRKAIIGSSQTLQVKSGPLYQSTDGYVAKFMPRDEDSTPLELVLQKMGKHGTRFKARQFNDSPFDPANILPRHSVSFQDRSEHSSSARSIPEADGQPESSRAAGYSRAGGPDAPISLITPEQVTRPPILSRSVPMKERLAPPILKQPTPKKAKAARQTQKNTVVTPKEQVPVIDPELARQQFVAKQIIQKEIGFEGDELQKALFGEIVGESGEDQEKRAELERVQAERRRQEKKKILADKEAIELAEKQMAEEETENARIRQDREEKQKKAKREAERRKHRELENQQIEEKRQTALAIIAAGREKATAERDSRALEKEKANTVQVEEWRLKEIKMKQEIARLQAASLNPSSLFSPDSSKKRKQTSMQNAADTLFVNEKSVTVLTKTSYVDG